MRATQVEQRPTLHLSTHPAHVRASTFVCHPEAICIALREIASEQSTPHSLLLVSLPLLVHLPLLVRLPLISRLPFLSRLPLPLLLR